MLLLQANSGSEPGELRADYLPEGTTIQECMDMAPTRKQEFSDQHDGAPVLVTCIEIKPEQE